MISADDFQALSRRAESAVSRRDKAAGAAESLLARMADEFGVDTLDAADAKLAELERDEAALAREYLDRKAEFEKDYAEELR